MENKQNVNSPKINRQNKEMIEQNFNLSVVIPFYKKLKAFKNILPRNRKYFERNGIEVIIVLDCPDEKDELIEYIKGYPFINWKVIYNDKPHEWRNPTKPINVGIKNATKKYVMVCSPESEFYTDALLQMRISLEHYPMSFAVGTVCFTDNDFIIGEENIFSLEFLPYGSIMVERHFLCEIRGYNESLNKWGGDDDNIRARLELYGIEEFYMPEVKLIHRDGDKIGNERRTTHRMPVAVMSRLLYPDTEVVNEVWGGDFNKIIYDWQDNIYAEMQLKNYLSQFPTFSLKEGATKMTYRRIVLVPTYNEKHRIKNYLEKNSRYFDGVILLDDESADTTYEDAIHDKLILKVKKKRREFHDLENRNILLDLVSFFKCEWICFIDADELIDERYSDLDGLSKLPFIDTMLFNYVHLWDSEEEYNIDYPYTNQGVGPKLKMFKNIGRSQIISKEAKLHFEHVPYIGRLYYVPILVKHYGHLNVEAREKKHTFYAKEDSQGIQADYKHLLNRDPQKLKVKNIKLNLNPQQL
jgi:glycosyltransferase involved in cell wall biosynthesis